MAEFIDGLTFNQLYHEEVVAPILKSHFPDLKYSAALIGWGSDVLGYDDPQSTDHNWGPRFQLFLHKQDYERERGSILRVLDQQLPSEYRGFPTGFSIVTEDVEEPPKHNVDVETIAGYFSSYLGCDPHAEIKAADWLTFSEHKLLGVTSGRVFQDGLGELEPLRRKFSYYPNDVWLYMLAAQWDKIFEEQAFVGRCGYAGDELGSMLIAARQVKNLMRLCFLMERKYAPYSKWFGTAFSRLNCAGELSPIFMDVVQAQEWKARQEALARAYEIVSRMHNALQITGPIQEAAALYHGRPYLVSGDGRHVDELIKLITAEEVRSIKHRIGSLNQFADSNDQLNDLSLCEKLKELYT